MYNITRGQLIVVWIAGIIVWLRELAASTEWYGTPIDSVLALTIPFILLFYTLGWRVHNIHRK